MIRTIVSRSLYCGILSAAVLAGVASTALAAETTKEIVLDRLTAPAQRGTPSRAVATDAMAVSVLLESADGTLTPRSTDTLFHTGDRFRVKLLASRDGKVSLYNTNPRGMTDPKPLWQGEVRLSQETITARLALTGTSGVDQLHVVFEPSQSPGAFAWMTNWFRSIKGDAAASKDIRLDVQNTPSATYVLNTAGEGLITTVRIAHTR